MQRAFVVVPPNDVATLTDPLVQIFGLSRPSIGQLEVRAAREKIGLLKVETTPRRSRVLLLLLTDR